MRKLAVSLVTLTSLTACSRGDEVGIHWSFEMPENLANDEEFARFGEQLVSPDYDPAVAVAPSVSDQVQPSFTPGGPVAALTPSQPSAPSAVRTTQPPELGSILVEQLEAEFEVVEEPDSRDPIDSALEGTPGRDNFSDLSIDELVELTFPQRGPRPDPLAQVRFSQGSPISQSYRLEDLYGATSTTPSGTLPMQRPAVSLAQSSPVLPSAFVPEQSNRVALDLRNASGEQELLPAINLSLTNDEFREAPDEPNRTSEIEPLPADASQNFNDVEQTSLGGKEQPFLGRQSKQSSARREGIRALLAKGPDLIPLRRNLKSMQSNPSLSQYALQQLSRLAAKLEDD